MCKNEYVLKNGSAENNSAIDFLSLFFIENIRFSFDDLTCEE